MSRFSYSNAYLTLKMKVPGVGKSKVKAYPDRGAMMVVHGPQQMDEMGLSTEDLLKLAIL